MFGLMQRQPLMISSIITFAARHYAHAEVVSRGTDGTIHRTDYATIERRARRLVRVLQGLGIGAGDRAATLAWNGFRHLEVYYAVSGMQAVCHTVNPRLSDEDVAYIINHAEDRVLFADTTFAPLIARIAERIRGTVRHVVLLADAAEMTELPLAAGQTLHCYEALMQGADEDYTWPVFDENTASALCYTSGTTGRPKGVLYSHRSTLLHAYAINMADVLGLRAVDRVLPVVPMFHVNAWGLPYAAPMAGAALIFPGRHLDGPSLLDLMNRERVTFTAGVPTVWLGLLQHMQASGGRPGTLQRLMTGGSACPRLLLEKFGEMGVQVVHGWGMTEISPVGALNSPTPATASLTGEAALRQQEKQGRPFFGVEAKIVDDEGRELPWNGQSSGNLLVRGPWVCDAYFGEDGGTRRDAEGWFATGDVATIDSEGFIEITDRTKDIIKSGGEWISSIALENIAVSHPDVAEAAAIAAPHPKWIERPVLLVVPKPDRTVTPESVRALYRGKVAEWWIPDAVLVVEELPHTATGKLHKARLRERYRNQLAAAAPAD